MIFVEKYGLFVPEEECLDKATNIAYTLRVVDVDVAVKRVRTHCVAVQAGGHLGLWARRLARTFELVYTFEPAPYLFEALKENTKYSPNIVASACALATHPETLKLECRGGGRSTTVTKTGIDVPAVSIDSLELPRCDLIYLDTERSELEILDGAARTIRDWNPVIALEVLKDRATATENWMRKQRYKLSARHHNDSVYVRQK